MAGVKDDFFFPHPNDFRLWVNSRNTASVFGFVWQSHFACVHRENFLVLDIFFEALNYETIEQKKAYDVAGLLGMICVSGSFLFWFNLSHTASSLKDVLQTSFSECRGLLTEGCFLCSQVTSGDRWACSSEPASWQFWKSWTTSMRYISRIMVSDQIQSAAVRCSAIKQSTYFHNTQHIWCLLPPPRPSSVRLTVSKITNKTYGRI